MKLECHLEKLCYKLLHDSFSAEEVIFMYRVIKNELMCLPFEKKLFTLINISHSDEKKV